MDVCAARPVAQSRDNSGDNEVISVIINQLTDSDGPEGSGRGSGSVATCTRPVMAPHYLSLSPSLTSGSGYAKLATPHQGRRTTSYPSPISHKCLSC